MTVGQVLEHPRVLPEGCVDTSSIDGIIGSLCTDGMSTQEQVLAIYHWFRRVVFHFRNMGADRRRLLRVVNGYGYDLCGSQTACMLLLFRHAGIPARAVVVDAGRGYGGHTCVEVFYDERWHVLDTMTSFCVFDRGERPAIAGLADLAADPSLVLRAEEEGRSPGTLLPCRHDPAVHYGNVQALRELGWDADLRWSTFAFGHKGEPGDLMGFWSQGPARRWLAGTEPGDTYGGRLDPGLLDLELKPNERWVMLWDQLGHWTVQSSYPGIGPHHTCGRSDEHDGVNFRYFEPYGKRGIGQTEICYRYYGNGFLEWAPADDAELALGSRRRDDGSLALPVRCPGPIVGGEAELALALPAADDRAELWLEYDEKRVRLWSLAGPFQGEQLVPIPYQASDEPFCDYRLIIATKGRAQAELRRLKSIYQLNIYALPTLRPGANVVHVSARSDRLEGSRLELRYAWNDGDGWQAEREHRATITEFPSSFTVDVAGDKMPRMRSLELRMRGRTP